MPLLTDVVLIAVLLVVTGPAPAPTLPGSALRVPLVRQATSYSCGAASLYAVLAYWTDFDGKEGDLYAKLETSEKDGTEPPKLAEVAKSFGLDAELKEGMTTDDLRAALKKGATVILSMQAWRTEGQPVKPWAETWEEGHYVVLVGMDDVNAWVMDPVVVRDYVWLPVKELADRWHDYEDRHGAVRRYVHSGVIIHGKAPRARGPVRME